MLGTMPLAFPMFIIRHINGALAWLHWKPEIIFQENILTNDGNQNGRKMQTMKIEAFLAIKPTGFRYLTRFLIEKSPQETGAMSCVVDVIFVQKLTPDSQQLRVRFIDCAEVTIGDMNGTIGSILGIRDISSTQLEGLRYRAVAEDHHFYFSLNCREFEFEVILPRK